MRFFALLLSVLWILPAQAAEITGLRIETGTYADRVSVRLTDKVKYRLFRVEVAPPRVVLDLSDAHSHTAVAMPRDYKGTLVRGCAFRQVR